MIIFDELPDSLGCELMREIKVLPRLVQVQGFVREWLQWPAIRCLSLVAEVRSRERKVLCGPLLKHLRGYGDKIGPKCKSSQQMVEIAKTRSKDMDVPIALVILVANTAD